MKYPHKFMRLSASLTVLGILSQFFPATTLADSTNLLGTVSITNIEQQGNNVAVDFQPLPEGLTVTARVDSEGHGDYLTIQSALADVKNGLIAVSNNRYNEHDLVIPAGVILKGGYDSRTWQPTDTGETVLFGLPGKTSIVLSNASAIANFTLEQAGTAIRAAEGASNVNRTVILQAEQAIAMSPFSYIRVANSDLVNNKTAIVGNQSNKVFVYNSIFQNNTTVAAERLDASSFVKNSLFFPNKETLQNLQDQDNQIAGSKPLPNAGWNFPSESGGTRVDQSFNFEGAQDTEAKTFPGPTLESTDPINALYLYYQISPGDILRIVDRDNFSKTVLETPLQGGNFRGWVPVPTTRKLALLLYSNGDHSLPLQIGVQATAHIRDSSYETLSTGGTQGIHGQSDEANFFYRSQNFSTDDDTVSEEAKAKVATIEKPLILAGNDWLTGKDVNTSNFYTLTHSKGFISQILTTSGGEIASQNFDQRAKQSSNDDRKPALLSDYLHFTQAFGLEEDCTLITTCPFEAEGLKKFTPGKQISLKETTDAIIENVGLLNNDGWNSGTNRDAKLQLDLGDIVKQGSVVWQEQIINNPATASHLLTFSSEKDISNTKNMLSIVVNPDGNLQIINWDKNALRTVTTTNGVSFAPGQRYQMLLSFDGKKATLSRNDGIRLWHTDNFDWQGVRYINAGKSPLTTVETQTNQVLGNITVWSSNSERKVISSRGNTLESTLENNEQSFQGSVSFQVPSFCQANSIAIRHSEQSIATISGRANGTHCDLTLSSPLTNPAQTTVPLTSVNNQPLQLIWQTNSFSGLTTLSLISDTKELLSTLAVYGSKPIAQMLNTDHLTIALADSSDSIQLQYILVPQVTLQNLSKLVPVQRYEIVYDTVESNVRNGIGTIVPITVEEIRKAPTPEKIISGLQNNQRYFFAARAILENGGSSETTSINNWQVHYSQSSASLQASSINQSTIPATLALGNTGDFQTAYADQSITGATASSVTGDIIQNHLGDPLQLHGTDGTQAWSLGKDIDSSNKEQAQHIYTFPGEYIVSSIRKLQDGTLIKQLGFVAIGGQSSDHPRITAETWIPKSGQQNWSNKAHAQKIPAVIGVNEPIYLLGQAVDVNGSSDNAFTWSYQVDWGDNSTTDNDQAKIAFNKTHRVIGSVEQLPVSHTYRNPGIYTIVSQVKDEENNIGVFENTVAVLMPEAYPNEIRGIAGSSRLVTISGGVAPYTITLPDSSTTTLPKADILPVTITDNSQLVITDHLGNTTSVPVNANENAPNDVYIPKDHSLLIEPNSANVREPIKVQTQGEDHLMRETSSHVYYFGDTLPPYLVNDLPHLNNVVTYTNEAAVRSDPFLTMGNFGAVLSVIDNQGKEQKKYFSLQITDARFVGNTTSGVVTGTIAPSFRAVPNSIEVWKRGSTDIKLASLTPNANGRFIYFLPSNLDKTGFISFRLKDSSGQFTDLTSPQGYNLKKQPSALYGVLEAGNNNILFSDNATLTTNAEKPTFFGKAGDPQAKYTLSVASDNPADYAISPEKNGGWIVESQKILAEGTHHFVVKNTQGGTEANYNFIVDRTAPLPPKITNATWTHLQGSTEPFAFVGIKAIGQQSKDYFVQADSSGLFSINPQNWSTQYLLAAADQAGNVSPVSTLLEKDWQNASTLSLWQKISPYILWSLLIALAATSIGYARKALDK